MRVNQLHGRRVVGIELAKARVARGMTQEQLGERIGRDAGTVANLERDHKRTSPQTLAAICEALGVTEDSITEKVPEPS